MFLKSAIFTFVCLHFAALCPAAVDTVAGMGSKGIEASGKPAKETALSEPFGIVRGPDGLLYFCEFTGHVVRKIEKNGSLTTVAGIPGKAGFAGDGGPATAATLNKPHELVFDAAGALYISDMSNHAIRKVDAKTGVITTVVGTGKKGFSGDGGPANKAECSDPISITIDPAGDLWFCDIGNHRLRKIDSRTGMVSTVCGSGEKKMLEDGASLSPETPLHGPRTLAFDAKGTGWLVLREGNAVYTFPYKGGRLKHVAGAPGKAKSKETQPLEHPVPAREAKLNGPKGIALSADGRTAYLADTESHSILKIESGKISRFVGMGKETTLARPHGVYVDADGYLYIGDSENHRVVRLPLAK